jgi:hypothetical protein
MSLNGNLEVFPLEEVLRLLARSRKTGCLRVESGGVQGRIFLNGGALTLATVAGDDELRRRLLASGLVTEADLRKVELSGSPVSESLAPDATPTALSEFVREESVEGLYRIRRSGRGSFDFLIDMNPRYPTGQSYDSEVIVSEADRRSLEWEDVESVLPSMDTNLRMVPVLDGEDAVTLSPSTWRILAALGSGASVSAIARVIGWSDFRSAREMASLYRNGLVTMVEPAGAGAATVATAPVVSVVDEPALDSYAAAPEPDPVSEQPAAETPAVEAPAFQAPTFDTPTFDTPAEAVAAEPAMIDTLAGAPTGDDPGAEVSEFGTWSDEVSGSDDAASEWSIPTADPVTPTEVQFDTFEEPAQAMPETADTPAFGSSDWTRQPSPEAPSGDEVTASDTSGDEVAGWWSDTAADPAPESAAEPALEALETPATPWNDSPWSAEIPTAEAPAEEPVVQSNPWGGWASTSEVTEDAEPLEAVDSVLESVDAAAGEPDRTGGWWAETMGGAEAAAERPASDNDADRFLESVFSSLSDENEAGPAKSEEDDDETGFGMGLLRRRRMGAAARDISDNNR